MTQLSARAHAAHPPERYDGGAVAFHWTVAALIVFLGILGLLFDEMPRDIRPFWINVHASVGLVYFVLVIARFGWRFVSPPPALPTDVGEFSRRASHAAHHLLYALMLAIPVFGIIAFVWHGRAFNYGTFQLSFGVPTNPAVYRPVETVHQLLAYALFAIAGLHAAVALWHQFVRRDGILIRMLPGVPW